MMINHPLASGIGADGGAVARKLPTIRPQPNESKEAFYKSAPQAGQMKVEAVTNLTKGFFTCAALVQPFAWASLSLCSA